MSVNSARGSRPNIDQVARLVDRYFAVHDGELIVGGLAVSDLAARFGTPLFIYDAHTIERKIAELRSTLPPAFELFYSIKANSNASILRFVIAHGCGLEVASAGELHQALQAGCSADRILFAGPGKTASELSAALQANIGEIHLESLEEAHSVSDHAVAFNKQAPVALRINPLDTAGGAMQMGGRASPFGIDEETLPDVLPKILALPNLHINGVHLFMGTQILDADILISQYRRALTIARAVAAALPYPLLRVDFGGGWGTPCFPHEQPLDLARLAEGLQSIADAMRKDPLLASARGLLEPGRFLVNEAGLYVARVERVKHSRGKRFVVVDGGMHHHLAASGNLGQTIKRNYPAGLANKIMHPPREPVDVVGPLCTPLDMLARQIELPPVEPGDLFTVFMSGAYARTASPLGFLSHNTPAEVLVSQQQAHLVRRRGTADDWLRDQLASYPTKT